MVRCNTITAEALGLPKDVRMVNAPLRQRAGLRQVTTLGGRQYDLIDTRKQSVNLRLTGDERFNHLSTYDIPKNWSVGVWYFLKGSTRFHEGYQDAEKVCGAPKGSDAWVEWTFRRAKEMGDSLGGNISLQAHYPNEIGPENAGTWVKMMEQTGVGVDSVVPFLFGPAEFQYGSLTNPNKGTRAQARQIQLETFQMARLLGVPTVNHWFGIDGYENAFAQDNTWMQDQIEGSTADAMNEVKGQQSTFEPKPYEPRGLNIMASTQDGILLALGTESRLKGWDNEWLLKQGYRLVGLTPEVGHMQMAYEVLPRSFEQAMKYGMLFGIHWNSQPLGNYDIDENPGLFSPETLDQIAYVLQRGGYNGCHTLDINPLRMPLYDAVMIGFLNLGTAFAKAKGWDHRILHRALSQPENGGNAIVQYMQFAALHQGTIGADRAMDRASKLYNDLNQE